MTKILFNFPTRRRIGITPPRKYSPTSKTAGRIGAAPKIETRRIIDRNKSGLIGVAFICVIAQESD